MKASKVGTLKPYRRGGEVIGEDQRKKRIIQVI